MNPAQARAAFSAARVACLATVRSDARPHLVPLVFALAGDVLYSAVDHKPKTTSALARFEHVRTNPRVSLLVQHYEEDWSALWWVRADGSGRVLEASSDEGARAISLLVQRYEHYANRPPTGPVLALDIESFCGWAAREVAPPRR